MVQRSGPWTPNLVSKVRQDVQTYFQTYYSELRRLVAQFDESANLPPWFKGGRKITATCCMDGLVVVHSPYERETETYPEREDSYSFNASTRHGLSVGRMVYEDYSTEMPDGRKLRVMPEYAPGEDFGAFVRLWPAYEGHAAPDGYEIGVLSQWTRLDATSMSNLNIWQSETLARHQAEATVGPYLEGEGPVPRSAY